jgi:mannose/cellobiose epimerase-like protein (N-acyl-D-glucosamine 2-epimerase family)
MLTCALALAAGASAQAATPAQAQDAGYQVKSEWLREPDKVLPYIRRNADFWKKSYDAENGGFFTMVTRDGTPLVGRDLKTTLTQSRHAYGFARAFMVTGDREYLIQARRAIDFLRDRGWDQEHGGFHTALDGKGASVDLTRNNPLSDEKWSFMQHYALLGIAAVADATRAPGDLAFLVRARNVIDEKLWDVRSGVEGYFETADYDWSHPRDKGFTPTVDGITTHGLSMYLLTREDRYRKRLLELADAIVTHLYPTVQTRKLGFAEKFRSDWRPQENEGFFFVGHVLKAAWCLERAYMVSPKPEYLKVSQDLLARMHEQAWDPVNGGPFYTGDSLTGSVTSREKNWWTLEQAITAGLAGYHLTGDELPLRMADESADFFASHLVDAEYGEVFASANAGGRPDTSSLKGDYWKAGYHSIETGYLVYLYGNLFLKRKPVTLYYAIDPAGAPRTIPLDPIAMEEGALVIREVRLDGKPYPAFDGARRTLTVPAGTGGTFQVTFAVAPGK